QQNSGTSIYADAQGTVYFTGRYEDHQLDFGPYQLQNATPWTYYYTDGYFGKIESITSGINEHDVSENSLTIYPNPTTDDINLKSNKRILRMMITDVSGKTIASTVVNDNVLKQHDISGFRQGMYFMQIFYDDGTSSAGKFIKN
ncbi:MAG TPA: T9SS type A sorting domain-containing protein, partial [Bacteroidia bacterium]|nr:T9SS type A sorting domain-containing protein [Bacteroidia bacterium]